MAIADIPPEILALSVSDRIELVAKIWDSITEESELGLSDEQKETLEERLAEHRNDPNKGETWEAVKAQLWNNR